MSMSFEDYIKNPMGEKNAVFSQREMYRTMYLEKLNKLRLREGDFKYYIFNNGDKYIIHFKIPSEVVEKFFYDVVIEFSPNSLVDGMKSNIKDYAAKFYSNDPSFVFTFAHAFFKNKMFYQDLVTKMSKLAIEDAAKEKNPKNVIGYVKSLYFAYLIMESKGLFNKTVLKASGSNRNYDLKGILNAVEHADVKISKRQEQGAEKAKKASIDKKRTPNNAQTFSSNVSGNSNRTGVNKTVKKVGTVKSSSKSKVIQRKK